MISALFGGVGLVLLGITLMTDGLKATAGGALRDLLKRFTGGPLRAFMSGAALTAIVQSSSATVVMTIGFVSAGLLTFSQAIGVIFGAAVGTTSTSWLIAFFGLRYSVSVVALPLVGVGALLRLLGRGKFASFGLVLAGFGLLFVGVDTLQAGMNALSERIQLGGVSSSGLTGRLLLVGVGVVMTVVMQSSTAAVVTTLAALHSGAIDLAQAIALVIGQNVGTTVTAALASVGASVSARRTALSHILLNSFSGAIAFVMLPLYVELLVAIESALGLGDAGALAVFHTALNLVGVMILLPFIEQYARLISRIVADRTPVITRFLDTSLLSVPSVAVEAARRTVIDLAAALVSVTSTVLIGRHLRRPDQELLEAAGRAAIDIRVFLGRIRSSPDDEREYDRHLAVLHATDHMDRLLEALGDRPTPDSLSVDFTLEEAARGAGQGLVPALAWLETGGKASPAPDLEPLTRWIAEKRRLHRPTVMERTAAGLVPPEISLETLDAMRWVDRAVYHVWRALHHLSTEASANSPTFEKFEDGPAPRHTPAVDDADPPTRS